MLRGGEMKPEANFATKAGGAEGGVGAWDELEGDVGVGIAVARGCRHYAGGVEREVVADRAAIPHEALGCALLQGPRDVGTFQRIRVAAMVLSDLRNSPEAMAEQARARGVAGRLRIIAQMALRADGHDDFWRAVLVRLPAADAEGEEAEEAAFLPGVSRLTTEARADGAGRTKRLVWLRTDYRR